MAISSSSTQSYVKSAAWRSRSRRCLAASAAESGCLSAARDFGLRSDMSCVCYRPSALPCCVESFHELPVPCSLGVVEQSR